METGRIKKLVRNRGFGFITGSDGEEVFFHRNECQSVDFDSLKEEQEVTFDREAGDKGPRALDVRAKTSG